MKLTDETVEFRVALGEFLRELRIQDMGIKNQRELAKKIGVSQPTISGVESGKVYASVYILYRYFDLAGVDHQEGIARLDKLLNDRRE